MVKCVKLPNRLSSINMWRPHQNLFGTAQSTFFTFELVSLGVSHFAKERMSPLLLVFHEVSHLQQFKSSDLNFKIELTRHTPLALSFGPIPTSLAISNLAPQFALEPRYSPLDRVQRSCFTSLVTQLCLRAYRTSLVAPCEEGKSFFRASTLAQIVAYGYVGTLRFKKKLKLLNVVRKTNLKHYYSFYNYRITDSIVDSPTYRVLIPELKSTRRGVLWAGVVRAQGGALSARRPSALARKFLLPRRRRALKNLRLSKQASCRTYSRPSLFKSRSKGRWYKIKRRLRRQAKVLRKRVRKFFRRIKRLRWLARRIRYFKRFRRNRLSRSLFILRMRSKRSTFKRAARKLQRRFGKALPFKRTRRLLLARVLKKNKRHYKITAKKLRPFPFVKSSLASSLLRRPLDSILRQLPIYPLLKPSSPQKLSSRSANLISLLPVGTHALLNPTLFKILAARQLKSRSCLSVELSRAALRLQNQASVYLFGPTLSGLSKSNLWICTSSNYVLRKRLLRLTTNRALLAMVTMWYHKSLVRFIEDSTGRKAALSFGPYAENALTFWDHAKYHLWGLRIRGFQRILGHKIFVYEALRLVAVALRLKDPTFLSNWIRGMLKRMSFWKYRLLFRYLKFLMRHIFGPNFQNFQFRGLKLQLKGKISVAGNARTRTLFYKIGDTSHSKMQNKVAYDLNYVNTFTGILGFKLWFFY